MKEPVRQLKHTWIAAVAIPAIGVAYFVLLGTSDFPEPGANTVYDIQEFEDLDKIETNYDEKTPIVPNVENPRALAVAQDKLYVGAQDAVLVFDGNDAEIARYALPGTPNCIAVAPDGVVYAGIRNKVHVLDASGAAKAEWAKDFADRSYITSIAVHGEDVYVADAGKRVVYRFNREGVVQARIGEKDPARDIPGLEVPSPYLDLAINPDGDVWVVNPGKLGLEQYRKDGSLVTSWYRPSLKLEGFPGCCNPTHIAFDGKGELYTCEKGLVRVKSFEVTSGAFEGLVAGSKLFPQEQSLRDLVVDTKNRLLVLDGQRKAIRVFALKETAHVPATHQPT
ncbi:MAG: hypothetical protein K1Y02_05190 [Candidatus Hydrogenedentes bacterium]|nr:hypothetical protein [Candidatus Hydrogenedentota bacterium]